MSKNWNPHEGQDQQQSQPSKSSSSSNTHAIQGRFQTLRSTFEHHPFSEHQAQWDALWKNSITPWDRGGPSMALHDLLIEHPDLFPHEGRTAKPKALVPGCGRGHDALLLAYVFGYDVCALDSSATSLEAAAENERRVMANEEGVVYALREGVPERGKVHWVQGDFFSDEWRQDFDNNNTGPGTWAGYDLIFDYAFFVALPPEARPNWAKRMTDLLNPVGGRLVCLEWPLDKPPSTGGPPWGVSGHVYLAHLGHPGKTVSLYDRECQGGEAVFQATDGAGASDEGKGGRLPLSGEDQGLEGRGGEGGNVDRRGRAGSDSNGRKGGDSPRPLRRLARFQPSRTHKAGCDEDGTVLDRISVWGV